MSSGPAMKSVREDSLAGEKDEGSWLSVLTPSPKFPTYNKKKNQEVSERQRLERKCL